MTDMDDILEPILKWTLPLWVLPFAMWYFVRLFFHSAWNWVTEPEQPDV